MPGPVERLYRIPVRLRLALVSATLTLLILMAFSLVVGQLASHRLRADFDNRLTAAAANLQDEIQVRPGPRTGLLISGPDLTDYASAEDAVVRIVTADGHVLRESRGTPSFGAPGEGFSNKRGYRVTTRPIRTPIGYPLAYVQYGRPHVQMNETIGRLWLFLLFGTLGGAALALLAGLAVARRAMRPIAALTGAAREIERTRDPGLELPRVIADDEVADLARTLGGMLAALDQAHDETEGMLQRQREFVADASHELRTPLTSVLANLELLQERLGRSGDEDDRELVDAALRSSRRMRRLVADLLLLARADAGRQAARTATDLGKVVRGACAELEPVAATHALAVRAPLGEAVVLGSPDELAQLVINLVENALRHTPAGTPVEAAVEVRDGEAQLTVSDRGPGVPPALRERIFERFVRTGGDVGSGTGLGLAIVKAVAEGHGGSVELADSPAGGACFVVRLPLQPAGAPEPQPGDAAEAHAA